MVPLVAALTHPDGPDASGKCFEVGAGFVAEIRWERSKGVVFKTDETFTPSAVKARWTELTDFANADHPKSMGETDMAVSSRLEVTKSNSLMWMCRETSRQQWRCRQTSSLTLLSASTAKLPSSLALAAAWVVSMLYCSPSLEPMSS